MLFEQNAYSKARQYCQKALEVNPNYGNAYLLIGKMYAATSKSVFPNDGVLARAAYNAAIDKFEKAKQVDPSVAEEANTLISSYRAHLPSRRRSSCTRIWRRANLSLSVVGSESVQRFGNYDRKSFSL